MKNSTIFISFAVAIAVLVTQVRTVSAAPALLNEEEKQHPAGAALADYFSDITDYDAIMRAHEEGLCFGVIAQALWMTRKLNGDSEDFQAILLAKETGKYDALADLLEDEVPQNWGQFRKALLKEEKKNNLGCVIVMSQTDKEHCSNGNGGGPGNGGGGGQGNENSNGGSNGNGGGQGNGGQGGQGNGGGNQ